MAHRQAAYMHYVKLLLHVNLSICWSLSGCEFWEGKWRDTAICRLALMWLAEAESCGFGFEMRDVSFCVKMVSIFWWTWLCEGQCERERAGNINWKWRNRERSEWKYVTILKKTTTGCIKSAKRTKETKQYKMKKKRNKIRRWKGRINGERQSERRRK